MNAQKQKNYNKHKINLFLTSRLAIIFITLLCMTGCEKLDENSGKLEVMGKSYPLDICSWERDGSTACLYLFFASSDYKIEVNVQLYNPYVSLTGTFKMEGDKAANIIQFFLYYDDSFFGGDRSDNTTTATLKIKKSKNSYHFTLNGTLKGPEGKLEKIKLSYIRPL